MGTISFNVTTASPAQNLTKTYTDTDANINLALAALQWKYNQTINAAAGVAWTKDIIQELVNITRSYQQQTATIIPINPT